MPATPATSKTTRDTDERAVEKLEATAAESLAQLPSRRTLRRLWPKMAAIYGHRWTASFGEAVENDAGELTVAGETWQKGLAGLCRAQLTAGVNAALFSANPWPPTLPEFRALCLGIPPLAAVRALLARPDLQPKADRPFFRLVWRFIDARRLAEADGQWADRIVADAYDLARRYRMALGELPEEPVAAVGFERKRERPTRASQDVEDAYMHRIAETIGMTIAPDGQLIEAENESEPGDDDE